ISNESPEKTVQASTWVCLMPADHAENMEHIGSTLRNVKKQIKRAYPDAFAEGTQERIQVYPSAIGNIQSVSDESVRLSKIENLFLASHLNSEQKDIGAYIEAAFLASQQCEIPADFAAQPAAEVTTERSAEGAEPPQASL
ncbi:MAG: hypothetical protein AAF202_10225, partial [Pseudomonadota bacterium]